MSFFQHAQQRTVGDVKFDWPIDKGSCRYVLSKTYMTVAFCYFLAPNGQESVAGEKYTPS